MRSPQGRKYPAKFDPLKRSVFETTTIADVLRAANYHVPDDPKKNMLCPLHSEKTPSFTIFRGGFYCHGCGAKGGIAALIIALGFASTRAEAAIWIEEHVR
jgi:hypothetical protein